MKNKLKLICCIVMSCLMVIMLNFNFVLAHEMFYEYQAGNTSGNPMVGINLKWNIYSNGKLNLMINADHLQSVYSTQLTSVYNAWQSACPTKIISTMSSFSVSNVDFGTKTQTEWNDRWGNDADAVLGYTVLKSTDNIYVENLANAQMCSKKIKYANIYLHPNVERFGSLDRNLNIKRVLVHELGHVLCLGHSNGAYYPTTQSSVMKTGYNLFYEEERFFTPRTHDKNDINQKY